MSCKVTLGRAGSSSGSSDPPLATFLLLPILLMLRRTLSIPIPEHEKNSGLRSHVTAGGGEENGGILLQLDGASHWELVP